MPNSAASLPVPAFHRPAHRVRRDRLAVDVHRRAFVEDHHYVRTEHFLYVHRFLGPEEHLAAVGGRGEGHALLGHLAPVREREHLETARIGEDRAVPRHEAVQAAVRLDHLEPRAQEQVEGVAEHHFRAEVSQLPGQHALHRTVGADRHERRRLDRSTREGHAATPRAAVLAQQLELHAAHAWDSFGHNSIASP